MSNGAIRWRPLYKLGFDLNRTADGVMDHAWDQSPNFGAGPDVWLLLVSSNPWSTSMVDQYSGLSVLPFDCAMNIYVIEHCLRRLCADGVIHSLSVVSFLGQICMHRVIVGPVTDV